MIPQRTPSPPPLRRLALPPGHFLSLPPSYADQTPEFPSGVPSTSAHTSHGLAPNVASLASADFDVDVRTGFLPATLNVDRLPPQWEVWEEALDAARGQAVGEGLQLKGGREQERLWRSGIESMPVLDTAGLRASLPLLRRAHLVLTFLLHFYVHTSPPVASSSTSKPPLPIPASIAVPLLSSSSLLGLPPILTYADTVLYNFHPASIDSAPSYGTNPPSTALMTFTNTRTEEQFYIISALCEIAGAEALRLMRQSLDELFLADELALRRLTAYLKKLAKQIDKIGDITLSMMKEMDPEEFYFLIRPWFNGGDSDGPQSPGWLYQGSDEGKEEWEAENITGGRREGKRFSGPSAGQSSLIHAIDIFLTVNHKPQTEAENRPSDESQGGSVPDTTAEQVEAVAQGEMPAKITLDHTPVTADPHPEEATFVQRMLQYMPLQHRIFLLHLTTHPTPLRPLVVAHAASHPKLAEAYDGALEALKRFREKHMRIVSLFIVQQARKQPSARIRRMLGQEVGPEGPSVQANEPKGELRGTGGTPLFKFLKACRDNTTRAMVGKSAGPVYDLEKGE